jgi:hypothetical protein
MIVVFSIGITISPKFMELDPLLAPLDTLLLP